MIVILGASCAGKSTIERMLGLNRIISYTTRPIRANETPDVDYHFIVEDAFLQMKSEGRFSEQTTYNGWHYGIAKRDCKDDAVAVVEPTGFYQLTKIPELKITSFLIKAPERERVIHMMKRGDNVMESFRRIISDQGAFNGMEDRVDYVINNDDGKLNEAVREIKNILNL